MLDKIQFSWNNNDNNNIFQIKNVGWKYPDNMANVLCHPRPVADPGIPEGCEGWGGGAKVWRSDFSENYYVKTKETERLVGGGRRWVSPRPWMHQCKRISYVLVSNRWEIYSTNIPWTIFQKYN